MVDSKKNWVFQPSPKAEQLLPKFHKLVLGWVGSIDPKGIYLLNLYGCQAVRRKLNLLQKTQKMRRK